jgi:hypothetical protein
MGIALSQATLSLLDGRNYAVPATVNPGGSQADLGDVDRPRRR